MRGGIRSVNETNQVKTQELIKVSLFIALIIIQTWVPMLGYIPLPILPATIIHVTVIVAAIWLGWKSGAIVGLAWGINSMIRAYLSGNPFSFAVFTSPLISVIPRVLVPILVAGLYYLLNKTKVKDTLKLSLVGIAGAFFNTALVLSSIALFKQTAFLDQFEVGSQSIWKVLSTVIIINGFPEMVVGGVLTPIITKTLMRIERK